MKLIVWNYQSIGGDLTVNNLLEQCRLYTPDIVVLLETKNNSRSYVYLKRKLGMEFLHAVEPRGIGGGLCMFWRVASHVILTKYAEFVIEAKIWDERKSCYWRLFAIYASTDDNKRREQWARLSKRIAKESDDCLLIGDFNDILSNDEKAGGNYRLVASMQDFREFVARNELMDLGYDGYPFTWRNNRDVIPIQQRLDRGLESMGWHALYLKTKILHVVLEGSDHALLLLSMENLAARKGRRFMYATYWGKLSECRDLVVDDWQRNYRGSHAFWLCEKMKVLSRNLKVWYKKRGRNSGIVIDRLKEEIRKSYQTKGFGADEIHRKEKELKKVHKEKKAYWKVKSRVQWLNEGDKNTKFFHVQAMKRRNFNKIRGLENSNGCGLRMSMGFARSRSPTLLSSLNPVVQIPPMRAPGPDGYHGSFY